MLTWPMASVIFCFQESFDLKLNSEGLRMWNVPLKTHPSTFECFATIMQDEEDNRCGLDQREEPLSPGTVERVM